MMEILISCVIIGVLALILFPILQSAKPDKNEALHKKSTFVVERIINELSSDNTLYPNNGEYSSLSNTENVMYNNETHGGATKFCTLFASRIKLKPGSEVRCIDGEKSFTSEDGIDWYLPVSDFKSGAETIMVDLNGSEGPNIVGEDRFEYKVQPGFKIPKKEIDESTISVTPTAPTKEDPDKGEKPPIVIKESQAKYSISCTVHGGGQIFGTGDNKVNGNYTLVAVPNPGYKCDWFTKQVTVKDGDVTDCDVTCDPNIVIPKASTSTVTPPPITPPPSGDYCEEHPEDISCICAKNPSDPRCEEGEEEEKTYCAYVAWSGDKEYCRDSGKVCGKTGSKYNITISSRNKDYTASWTQGKGNGTFGNSDVVLMASCDNKNQCYALNINGDSNCPYTLPAGDCPTGEKDKYTSGQKYITVTPKEGYTFNGKTGTVHYPVTVNSTTTEIDLSSLCKAEETEKEIILTPHKEGNKIYVTPSEVVPFPMDVELGYETGEGTGNNWDFTINSNQNKSEEVIDTTFGGASCLCTEEWSLLNPSSTYTHEGITYTIKISNESEPKCSGCGGGGGSGDSCTVNLIGDGGFDGQVNAEVKLSGGASKSVTLSDSNNYRYKWKGLTCGKKYNVSAKAVLSSSANEDAWAEAELTATADPDEFTLQPDKEQDVLVTIKKDIPSACSISVEGTGDTGNGVFANISLSGGTSKSATLDESNMYLVTWSDLACDANYTVSVTKAGEKKNGAETTTKVTATVNPSGSFKIPESGTQDVKVDFKKDGDSSGGECINLNWKIVNGLEKGASYYDPSTSSYYDMEYIQTIGLRLSGRDGNSVLITTGGGFGSGEYRIGSVCLPPTRYPLTYGSVEYFNASTGMAFPIIVTANPNPISPGYNSNSASVTFNVTSPAKTVYTLTVKYQEEGTNKQLFPDDTYQLEAGYKQVIMAHNPPEGYKLGKNTHTNTVTTAITPLTMPNSDYTITFYYTNEEAKKGKVTMESAVNGTVSPSGTTTVTCGQALSIKATPNSGYKFGGWSKVSGSGSFADATAQSTTFTPTSDAAIQAGFGQDRLRIFYQLYMDYSYRPGYQSNCGRVYGRAYVLAPADRDYPFKVNFWVRDTVGYRPEGPYEFSGTIRKGQTEVVNATLWVESWSQSTGCHKGIFQKWEEVYGNEDP